MVEPNLTSPALDARPSRLCRQSFQGVGPSRTAVADGGRRSTGMYISCKYTTCVACVICYTYAYTYTVCEHTGLHITCYKCKS